MIQYSGINHLAMVTRDMDMTVRYWRDLLEMPLVAGLGTTGYRHYFFKINDSDLIAFFEWEGACAIEKKDHGMPVKGPVAFDHVAIGVETMEDLKLLMTRLDRAGFWVSEIMDHGFIYSIYSFDPNNIAIEFSCPVPGEDIRRYPKMKDRHPSAVTREGTIPRPEEWPGIDRNRPLRLSPDLDYTIYPGEGVIFRKNSD